MNPLKFFGVIAAIVMAASVSAHADDGSWNAGASNRLPNGIGGSAMSRVTGPQWHYQISISTSRPYSTGYGYRRRR